ncbi:MAG: ATP phosphoribosyltransferase [Proteobacteria bacterium]|nr:ATP phosphoribosyltransferase [Pseudomonadota bacterium]
MTKRKRLRIAVQKSGRLNEKSLALLEKCGIDFDIGGSKARLLYQCAEFPADLMLVRDDDIPEYVADGVCDLGIVGENVIEERVAGGLKASAVEVLRKLGFGRCRLSIAVPEGSAFNGVKSLNGKRIATSYPALLRKFIARSRIKAEIVELSGSVEIAPALEVADAVCDLVSTGGTLRSNGLKEILTVLESQAVLIRTKKAGSALNGSLELLLRRVDGVLRAAEAKYIMMNASRDALPAIQRIIPGMEEPSIMPLGTSGKRIAIHAVAHEPVFWETIERLKEIGASSILVLPIEKIIA